MYIEILSLKTQWFIKYAHIYHDIIHYMHINMVLGLASLFALGGFFQIITSRYTVPLFSNERFCSHSSHENARKYTISSRGFSEVQKLQTEHEGSPPFRC